MSRRRGRKDAQPRPDGPYYLITDEWRAELLEKLQPRGARARLAEAIGATPAAISGVLKPQTSGSRYVEAISEALDIPLPSMSTRGSLDVRWMEAGRSLDPDDFRRLVELAESLAQKKH